MQNKSQSLNFESDPLFDTPDQPLPQVDPEDNDWEDEPPVSSEEVFTYYLEERSSRSYRKNDQIRSSYGYKERVRREKTAWKLQEEEHVNAYLIYSSDGSFFEENGPGMDYFTCKLYDIQGMRSASSM